MTNKKIITLLILLSIGVLSNFSPSFIQNGYVQDVAYSWGLDTASKTPTTLTVSTIPVTTPTTITVSTIPVTTPTPAKQLFILLSYKSIK